MKNNVLVTGCVGFIGFHLVNRICKSNYNVFGIDCINNYYDITLKNARLDKLTNNENFHFSQIDLSNFKALNEFFENNKIDFIIHLAAQAGVRYSLENPKAYLDSNIIGFTNVLEFCRKKNINIIYASSSSVYGDSPNFPLTENLNCSKPVSLYGASKIFNEHLAFTYNNLFDISSIGLRFFTVYGPWGRPDMAYFSFTKSIIKNEKINVYNNGNHSRSFTYIDDIIDAIELLVEKYIENQNGYYEILNIGGDKSILLNNFIQVIEDKLNKKANINYLPKQPGDVDKTESNCKKINNLVGYSPKVDIKVGMDHFIDWYMEFYKND